VLGGLVVGEKISFKTTSKNNQYLKIIRKMVQICDISLVDWEKYVVGKICRTGKFLAWRKPWRREGR